MKYEDENKGLAPETKIDGGVAMTPDTFEQGVICTGKNTELSAEKGTLREIDLITERITGKKPIVRFKVEGPNSDQVVGGEIGWEGDSEVISERGVYDVFEGKVYFYRFNYSTYLKMIEYFKLLWEERRASATE